MATPEKSTSDKSDKVAHAIGHAFRGIARKVASGADLVMDPLGHYERDKEEKRLKANRKKLAAVMERRESGPQVHVLKGHGPLGTDTIVVDKGTEYRADSATVDDDGTVSWDIAGRPPAIINTRAHIEQFLDTHADAYLFNSRVYAELGHQQHYLGPDTPGVKIGAAISVFRPLSEKDRYEVINPIVAAVTLLGPQLAGIAGEGVVSIAPSPGGLAEAVGTVTGMVTGLVGGAQGAKNVVDGGHGGAKPLDIGEPIFIVGFSETGFAPANDKLSEPTRLTFECTKIGERFGVRIGDVADQILAALPAPK